jgi:shikimate kinase
MGSGKSTIGPILANTIGYEFVDLDRSIEEVEKESVSMIFRDHGEEYFRSRERTMLAKACGMMHVVVALGGGTLADEQNLQLVHASGVLVYLKLSREQVFLRLRRRNDRPLLSGPDGMPLDDKQLHKRIEDLYEAREPLYATADLTVQTDESRLGLTVDSLVRQLTPLLG